MIRLLVLLPRLLATAVIGAIGAVGVLLILEAVDVIDTDWRNELSRAFADFAVANWAGWAIALIGVGLAACAAVLGFGLFTTARPGGRRLFVLGGRDWTAPAAAFRASRRYSRSGRRAPPRDAVD